MFKKLLITFLFTAAATYAQLDSTETATEDVINDLLEEPSEEVENSELYEIFEDLQKNPVDINTASISDIQRIPLLNFSDAEIIVKHREKYGRFFSTGELYSVQGIQFETIKKILPFVKVNPAQSSYEQPGIKRDIFNSLLFNSDLSVRSRVVKDLQTREGFSENKFAGSPYKVYNRILGKLYDNVQFGVLTEKDAGEKPINEFVSMHLAANNIGIFKKIIIGDYLLEFGQGLTLWSPYGYSKGPDAVYSIKKRGRGITPFKSTDENKFFRGLASEVNYSFLNISVFYSKNFFDANIDSSFQTILSTPIDGLHRTDTELGKRKTANESFYGIDINSEWNESVHTGILFYSSKFSNPFLPSSAFDKNGSYFRYYSFYFDIIYSGINLTGEVSFNGKSAASVAGLQFSPNKNFSFAVSFRNYPANFINLHGFGFGENSGAAQNELGFYTGFKWSTNLGTVNFYFDQFKFPYDTYSNPLPTEGNEFFLGLSSNPFTSVETRVRFKYEKKNVSQGINNLISIIDRIRQSIRTEVSYRINKSFSLKGRIEYNKFDIKSTGQHENGILAYQEIKVSPAQWLSLSGRIILFNTDSFNSAVYEYESGLNGVLSNPALFGDGIRWYAIAKVKPALPFVFSFKYSETYKPDEKSLGSGYSTINGNLDNNFVMQVDISL